MSRDGAAGPGAIGDPIPKTTSDAGDIEAARKSVEDAAPIFLGLWLSYLGASAYLVITIGAVTHKDLFLGNTVKLPLLSETPLPMVGFFILAPISFVILHAYILVHFRMLAAKIRVLDVVERQSRDDPDPFKTLEWQLPSNIFVQLIAKRPEFSRHGLNLISLVIAWSTLVIGPIGLLLLAQARFLPLHYAPVTWLHRCLIIVDIAFLWWLWPPTAGAGGKAGWRPWVRRGIGAAASAVPGFWLLSATFPGEPPDTYIGNRMPLHDWLFRGPYDEQKQRRTSVFSNTLVLPGFSVLEAPGIDEAELAGAGRRIMRKNAHLEGAIFRGADLRKVNLEQAFLQGADFFRANLQSSQFYSADLAGAELFQAKLELASFGGARLQGADLGGAELQGAWLRGAQLQGASLDGATLQGATLIDANLEGAGLRKAKLQGANFAPDVTGTYLTGANLSGAELGGTVFKDAKLKAVLEDDDEDGRLNDAPLSPEQFKEFITQIDAAPQSYQLKGALDRANMYMNPAKDPPSDSSTASGDLFKNAHADLSSYQSALVEQITNLICLDKNEDAESIMRGLIRDERGQSLVRQTGPLASELVKTIMSPDCPVSSVLTDQDKTTLECLASFSQHKTCPDLEAEQSVQGAGKNPGVRGKSQ